MNEFSKHKTKDYLKQKELRHQKELRTIEDGQARRAAKKEQRRVKHKALLKAQQK